MRITTVLLWGTTALALSAAPAMAQGSAAKGAALYASQKCAMCHSLGGKGQIKGPLDDVGTRRTAEEIRLWIVDPVDMTKKTNSPRKPAMRAYPRLTAADVEALVAFLVGKRG